VHTAALETASRSSAHRPSHQTVDTTVS
jgi:hypothetical protein